jgi:hypothetical protein
MIDIKKSFGLNFSICIILNTSTVKSWSEKNLSKYDNNYLLKKIGFSFCLLFIFGLEKFALVFK